MKKVLVSAACLAALLAPAITLKATNNISVSKVIIADEDEKTQIKAEELPDAVKKTLADEKYKGWDITAAYSVKSAKGNYYQVDLTKEKETKVFKFDNEGKILE